MGLEVLEIITVSPGPNFKDTVLAMAKQYHFLLAESWQSDDTVRFL